MNRYSMVNLLKSRWISTVASIWIQCATGCSYTFGIYSPVLKSTQHYNQSTLNSVSFFKDVGANCGLLSGILYSSSLSIGGPWIVHAVGVVQGFAGYFLIWLSVIGVVPNPPIPLMCLYMFLAAHSQTFFNTANVVTAVQNFPRHKGTAVGIMKGFLGLSGAILIELYQTMFRSNPSSFLLMLSLLPTLVPLLLMCLVKVQEADEENEKRNLDGLSLSTLIVAGYLMLIILWGNVQPLSIMTRVFTSITLLIVLFLPLIIAIKAHFMNSQEAIFRRFHDESNPLVNTNPVLRNIAAENSNVEISEKLSENGKRKMEPGRNMNLLETMSTCDFWLLFIVMSCGMGSGLATVNNISQIGASLGYTITETRALVSLWSIWNFLGRFGAGYVSDYFLHSRCCPRPLFLTIALASMSIGHALISSGLPGALYGGSILVGVCYGSLWSLMPTITSEIFSVRHMGTIFNTISVASPLGSYIFSVKVLGYIYDLQAKSDGDDENTCHGTHCFMLSFLIMSCVAVCGFLVSLALYFRTRRFYKQVVFSILQHSSTR